MGYMGSMDIRPVLISMSGAETISAGGEVLDDNFKMAIGLIVYVLLAVVAVTVYRKRYPQKPRPHDKLQKAIDDSINKAIDKADPNEAERFVP